VTEAKISIINASNVLTDQQIEPVVPALQKQVTNDFAPIWGASAQLDFVAKGRTPPQGRWWLTVVDTPDHAAMLGFHDLTPDGLPLGKVFAGTDRTLESQWTVTASHELLEMLADPGINLNALNMTNFDVQQSSIGRLYAYEVCDACEADKYAYGVDGVQVSDFVFPAWFEAFHAAGSTQFDFREFINQPFQLLPGGYISVYDVTSGTGWHEVSSPLFAEGGAGGAAAMAARPPVGSRRERRRTPRNQWVVTRLADAHR